MLVLQWWNVNIFTFVVLFNISFMQLYTSTTVRLRNAILFLLHKIDLTAVVTLQIKLLYNTYVLVSAVLSTSTAGVNAIFISPQQTTNHDLVSAKRLVFVSHVKSMLTGVYSFLFNCTIVM